MEFLSLPEVLTRHIFKTFLLTSKMTTEYSLLPKITIGMPVFNGGAHIRAALDSLLGQTYRKFIIIISDNASTDDTEATCRDYASSDSRIRYIRQEENIGPEKNFAFLLGLAKTEFFVWAAVDDIRSPDYLAANISFLERNFDYVASTSPTRFDGRDFDEMLMGDLSLEGDTPSRMIGFLQNWHANAFFYSITRTSALQSCTNLGESYLGADWYIVLHLAKLGRLKRIDHGYTILGKNGESNSVDFLRSRRKRSIELIFPFWTLSRSSLSLFKDCKATISQSLKFTISLALLNLRAAGMAIKLSLKGR